MGGLCSKSVKGDKVFAKSDGHSDNHKSNGKNHNSTNMPSNLTSARDHGMDKKKQEVVAAAGNGYDDFYDGLGCCHVRGYWKLNSNRLTTTPLDTQKDHSCTFTACYIIIRTFIYFSHINLAIKRNSISRGTNVA